MRDFRRCLARCLAGLFLSLPLFSHATHPLTRAEQTVCASLHMCLDLVKRHDASAFDYAVLADEFQRYGAKGRAALFDMLESDAGSPDMAGLLLQLGPLSDRERAWRDANWVGPLTDRLLPLADETSDWTALLDHDDMALREMSNRRIFLRDHFREDPIPRTEITDYRPLLSALRARPSAHLAGLLDEIPVAAHADALSDLLLSGERMTVGAAYTALHRDNPDLAFQSLLTALKAVETVDQARGIGGMLADRNLTRPDGFYAGFAARISGDADYSTPARAAALDGYLKAVERGDTKVPRPHMSPARQAAFAFLLSRENPDTPRYVSGLKTLSPARLPDLWAHLDTYLIMGADQALKGLAETPEGRDMVSSAALSRDGDVRRVARDIASEWRLELPTVQAEACSFIPFDIVGLRDQMPFFEGGFIAGSWPQFMTPASRRNLSSAHPTPRGWMAGYDVGEFGGGLVHYDNATGEGRFIRLGTGPDSFGPWEPQNVVAILPDRPLRLGQVTDNFWVLTELNHMGSTGETIFFVSKAKSGFDVRRMAHNIASTHKLAVSPQGDLLMGAEDDATVRLTQTGDMFQGCATARPPVPSISN